MNFFTAAEGSSHIPAGDVSIRPIAFHLYAKSLLCSPKSQTILKKPECEKV